MKDKIKLLFKEKPVTILIALKRMQRKKYSSKISRETNCTYAHTTKILRKLEEIGFDQIKKNGRVKDLKLTEKGNEVVEQIIEIQKITQ